MIPINSSTSDQCKIVYILFRTAERQEYQKNYLNLRPTDYTSDMNLTEILDGALELLNEDARRIIKNDFKYQTAKKWWEAYYSQTTYYRLRAKAVREFLEILGMFKTQ